MGLVKIHSQPLVALVKVHRSGAWKVGKHPWTPTTQWKNEGFTPPKLWLITVITPKNKGNVGSHGIFIAFYEGYVLSPESLTASFSPPEVMMNSSEKKGVPNEFWGATERRLFREGFFQMEPWIPTRNGGLEVVAILGAGGDCYWAGRVVPRYTPPKINIESENDGLEDDFPFPGGKNSQVPVVHLPGCNIL